MDETELTQDFGDPLKTRLGDVRNAFARPPDQRFVRNDLCEGQGQVREPDVPRLPWILWLVFGKKL